MDSAGAYKTSLLLPLGTPILRAADCLIQLEWSVYVSTLVDPYRSAVDNNGSGFVSAAMIAIVEWIVNTKNE